MSEPSLLGTYVLAADVQVVRRRESLLLVAGRSGRTVRVSPAAVALIPSLQSGVSFTQLRAILAQGYPVAPDVDRKLHDFLQSLSQSGVLQDATVLPPRPRRRLRFPLLPTDPVARWIAWPLIALLPSWTRIALALTMALAAIAAIGVLACSGELPRLRAMIEHLHWAGVALFVLCVVPLHELSHAVACRIVGISPGKAGIMLHAGAIPGPYVETHQTYLLVSRWKRFVVPAAGPFVNLVAAGVVAGLLILPLRDSVWVPVLHTLLMACLLFVFFDTCLLTSSDGSHCAEALFDDEWARRNALRPLAMTMADGLDAARRYRLCAALHLAVSTVLFAWWIF
ncbi:site-2 protease family protein [Xanthomonas sp. MUS 060]|uniref:site-2 protease family protein n=1 Tax=Xanthomonas sp. MUS 060 TaxID=1588031 RepID=UPI000AD843AC|nr:site-2 protease family protein [Xanthomonas sp. MUS 060]